jgi:DNA-binding HxlR family transcriptional regulator
MREDTIDSCRQAILPASDALHVLSGRWKLHILLALTFADRRFGQLCKDIPGITPKTLSKELRELELNELVSRRVYDTVPISVEYALTDYGRSLKPVLVALRDWGLQHRERIMATR